MDTIEKSNLLYEYTWSVYKEDDPRIHGLADATKFDRKEGYEVLYIIRQFTDHLGCELTDFRHRVEKLIHDQLPEDIQTQKDTIHWIHENWK